MEKVMILEMGDESLSEAAKVLLEGGVIVLPTDTVYGLAAHPSFPAAVERLYTIKGREAKKPIALLASDTKAVTTFGGKLSEKALALAKRGWPGPLTLVVSVGDKFEGFRVPNHNWTRKLLSMVGGVLRVTSANLSGCKAATEVSTALKEVGLSADLVINGGPSKIGVASTVVKVTETQLELLRPGPIELKVEDSLSLCPGLSPRIH